jgi:hypothetical protein
LLANTWPHSSGLQCLFRTYTMRVSMAFTAGAYPC